MRKWDKPGNWAYVQIVFLSDISELQSGFLTVFYMKMNML
jgi:hypothetical protein